MRIILIGAPGSGKGTQAESIRQKYLLPTSRLEIYSGPMLKRIPSLAEMQRDIWNPESLYLIRLSLPWLSQG